MKKIKFEKYSIYYIISDMNVYEEKELMSHCLNMLNRYNVKAEVCWVQEKTFQPDAIITLKATSMEKQFNGVVRQNLNSSDVLRVYEISRKSPYPILLITPYISRERGMLLQEAQIEFIDAAGNSYIESANFNLFLNGFPKNNDFATVPERSLHFKWGNAAIRSVFTILNHCINSKSWSFFFSIKWLTKNARISQGAASNVRKALLHYGYLEKNSTKKYQVINPERMLKEWLEAYCNSLYNTLLLKRVWLTDTAVKGIWGAESAASRLTGNLHPAIETLYIDGLYSKWRYIFSSKIVSDKHEAGGVTVEIRQAFWNNEPTDDLVPTLLVYADLLASGLGRNIEIGQEIYEKYLRKAFNRT